MFWMKSKAERQNKKDFKRVFKILESVPDVEQLTEQQLDTCRYLFKRIARNSDPETMVV